MTNPVIEVENLTKVYGQVKAVDGISFQVNRGEIFGMLGPNGAGKTTTVEILEGLRIADAGKVKVLGLDIAKSSKAIKQKIGIQLQAPALLPMLNVEQLLTTFAGFYDRALPIDQVIDIVSLSESRKIMVKNLSGGQQQRLSVAMAMINDPEIAFLDEPTTGLDPQARRGLWSAIEIMRDKGKTVFLTTHYMEEAEKLCDRVAIIDHGKIISLDSPASLIHEQFAEKAIEFEMENPPAWVKFENLTGVTNVKSDGSHTIIYSFDIPATMLALLNLLNDLQLTQHVRDLHLREATLEDVFLKLTGRKIRE